MSVNREWGPFTVVTGTTPNRRRVPMVRLQRISPPPTEYLDPYLVGVLVSWLGRQVSLTRNRWWDHRATWAHQLTCKIRREHRLVTSYVPVTFAGAVWSQAERVECGTCGHHVSGPT